MSTLELKSIEKTFDQTRVIPGVDLQVKDGEFVVFVGPSGCGKSTLLRMIAGLDMPTSGDLLIDGQRVNDVGAADRGCAMVFQSYALYPHMTVYDNMAFGLENAKVPKADIEQKVRSAAALLRLDQLLARKPTQLSGGQRQRVAIGRAIVRNPKIFLFDEPLSNLDAELRISMRSELRELHRRLRATMVYVTHDQVEAMTMADKIVVLRAGRIEQIGAPQVLYEKPCNTFVAGFIGSPRMNFLPAALVQNCPALAAEVPAVAKQIGIRPEHWIPASAGQGLALTVTGSEYLGAQRLVQAKLPDQTPVELLLPGDRNDVPQDVIHMTADAGNVHAFDSNDQRL
ncbi:MAG: sn-glycerol-3-phosphate ABC transporter ATP-binding protein UgpC [Comamonas sp.]